MFETQLFSCSSMDSNETSQDKNMGITTRKRSCNFVNTPLPCINKVIHHIQEFEVKMEKWLKQYDYVLKKEKIPWLTKHVNVESTEDTWLSSFTKLDSKEAPVSDEDGKTLTLKLEAEALLWEVTELIRRLEAEREEAEKALELEKQRRKMLTMKMDRMSLWRLQELPAAVQKEYEMCLQDILELQWHFDCKRRQLQQVQTQILQTEAANRKIQEDIDLMKKHSPLLEEKLKLESEALQAVLQANEKALKIYNDVYCELMEIQKTIKRTDEESENKMKPIYEKIKLAEMLWSQYKNELKHSESIWTEYCMKLKETEEKIIKDEKHLEELVKQKAEIQEDAKYWNSKIEELTNKIPTQEEDIIEVSDAPSEVFKTVEELKSTRESELQNTKQKLLNTNEALDFLKLENEELKRENEKFLQKIRNSSRKKKAYQSEIKIHCENLSKIEEEIERLNEDIRRAELSYSEAKKKYDDLKKTRTAEEMSYENLESNLKKEIEDQKGVCELTQDRIKAIYDELGEKKKEKLKKGKEDMKRIEDVERKIADLEEKFKRNKDICKDNHKKLSYLDQRIRNLDKQQKQAKQELEQKKSTMQQQLCDIEEKISFISKQVAENSHATENLRKELKELNKSWKTKQIQVEKAEKSLTDLWKTRSDVMFKQQSVQMVFNHLQDELAEYEKRLKQEEEAYGELLQIRKKYLKDSEAALEEAIKENLWLAQEYQIFQNYYLNDKDDLTKLYENRIRVEAYFRDHQQGELSEALQHMTSFLHSLTDGSPATDNNANNQCILDAKIKDKKSHTVQITV
ncbi:coiled-coil domain-containing protein 178 [Calypte anna]|uniref:coiled-coil domain-containing protein 178 n=1 Tax=Calypte anna TaxID=9244 RepID=UPI0011C3CD13|nr:coiled-coil domain-containing protein 178 [Calypte anna]